MSAGPALAVEALSVRFGPLTAVDGVSFTVADGESFGLVGESGSGKTTVLRVLAGLLAPAGGVVRLFGEPVVTRRPRALRRAGQLVFQDPYASLHPRHTVDRILSEPCAIHRLDRRAERVVAALETVGLGASFRFRYPHQLSGGQRQRVAIARAVIVEPRVVLLDEPTSALDVSIQAEVLNLLARLGRERRLTYVLVSHNLPVVAHLCARLAVMQRGRLVEELSQEALRAMEAREPYTRQLLRASGGYDRAVAEELIDFA